jgi:serine/threonine protein kinase
VEEGDRPSIVMELVPFRSLRDAVAEDGPMSPAEAAGVGLCVLAALRAVHDVGVHRDVKPASFSGTDAGTYFIGVGSKDGAGPDGGYTITLTG